MSVTSGFPRHPHRARSRPGRDRHHRPRHTQRRHRSRARRPRRGMGGGDPADRRLVQHIRRQAPRPTVDRTRHPQDPPARPVTPTELADHIHAAFAAGPATRADLLAAAVATSARPRTIELLHRLPDKTYASIRELWYDLPDVPVSR